jgi:hypothetical protein
VHRDGKAVGTQIIDDLSVAQLEFGLPALNGYETSTH